VRSRSVLEYKRTTLGYQKGRKLNSEWMVSAWHTCFWAGLMTLVNIDLAITMISFGLRGWVPGVTASFYLGASRGKFVYNSGCLQEQTWVIWCECMDYS
jgi:hypothetical protein